MKLDIATREEEKDKLELKENNEIEVTPKKRGYGLDQYYEEEKLENEKKIKEKYQPKHGKSKKKKKKRTVKQKIFLCIKILLILIILFVAFLFVFFKTNIFQKYKELWVQTAMTTMNHQYLATWFLSDEEIAEIMKSLEVENNENSNSENIVIESETPKEEKKEITVEKITGKGYVGYVMVVPEASKVKLVDARLSRTRNEIERNCKKTQCHWWN